ncbi:MAG: hypothetical protein RL547_341 [Actinomycetota bacterium]
MNSGLTTAGRVSAVHRSALHSFSKEPRSEIELIAGHGVAGDAHCGSTVRHRSRVAKDPTAPNLRQVHLIANETLFDLQTIGFDVHPGDLGENVTTEGVDWTKVLTGTRVVFDGGCIIEITGLRNPCYQIDSFCHGLLDEVRSVAADGTIDRRAGVMGVVLVGGLVSAGIEFRLEPPPPGATALVVV